MLEKAKTILLIFFIVSSLVLTYRLWFGGPHLEEVMLPSYEYAFFTPPPEHSEVIKPSKILYRGGDEEALLYYRGQEGYEDLWDTLLDYLKDSILANGLQNISEEDKNNLIDGLSTHVLVYLNPFVPLEFLAPERVYGDNRDTEVKEIVMVENDSSWYMFLRTENDNLLSTALQLDNEFRETVSSKQGHLYIHLPDSLFLDIEGDCKKQLREQLEDQQDQEEAEPVEEGEDEGDSEETNNDSAIAEENEEENNGNNGAKDDEVNEANAESEDDELKDEVDEVEDVQDEEPPADLWEIKTEGNLYLPEKELLGAEVALEKEDIPVGELVQAFFFDPSMARRIEERDEAIFFTDGEKGLRIYPTGLVEYAAPMLERGLSTISYSTALKKAAESQSLYGGWQEGSYLVESLRTETGYRFKWSPVIKGLPLEGENAGSEMLVNEQGIPYYSRNFFVANNYRGSIPFRPYAEALCEAIILYRDELEERRATLLLLKPVMYILGEGEEQKGVPAWKVIFEETGAIYLHWRSLEELPG